MAGDVARRIVEEAGKLTCGCEIRAIRNVTSADGTVAEQLLVKVGGMRECSLCHCAHQCAALCASWLAVQASFSPVGPDILVKLHVPGREDLKGIATEYQGITVLFATAMAEFVG